MPTAARAAAVFTAAFGGAMLGQRIPMPETTTPATPQQLLRDAAKTIEEATALLNTRSTPCGECGRKHYENLAQARAFEQLADVPDKLRRAAEKIEQQ